MIYALYFGIGLLFGFILARFLRVTPEQQAVCILNKEDGTTVQQTCLSTQKKACIADLKVSKQ